MDFEIAFKVKSSAHAAALSVFFEDVANTQIQAFEKRCRSLMSFLSECRVVVAVGEVVGVAIVQRKLAARCRRSGPLDALVCLMYFPHLLQ